MTALAVPQPSAVADVHSLCGQIEAALPTIDDAGMLHEAKAKLAAIDQYIAMTSTEGRAQVQATMRRVELRIGQVLGEATHYHGNKYQEKVSDATETYLSRHDRSQFRKMAANPDIVDAIIAESTDAEPPSRARVLHAIAYAAAQRKVEEDEQAVWQQSLGPVSDPAGDRKRQQVQLALIGVDNATRRLAEFTREDVAWAVATSFDHVRPQMIEQLRSSLSRLMEVTP